MEILECKLPKILGWNFACGNAVELIEYLEEVQLVRIH